MLSLPVSFVPSISFSFFNFFMMWTRSENRADGKALPEEHCKYRRFVLCQKPGNAERDYFLADRVLPAPAGRWPFLLLNLYSSIFLPKVFRWIPNALADWD